MWFLTRSLSSLILLKVTAPIFFYSFGSSGIFYHIQLFQRLYLILFNIYFQGFSPESQIHAFLDGLSKRMSILSDNYDEPSEENYRQENDEVDPSVLFLIANTDGDDGTQGQPSLNSMSRITRSNNIPFSPEMVKVMKCKC